MNEEKSVLIDLFALLAHFYCKVVLENLIMLEHDERDPEDGIDEFLLYHFETFIKCLGCSGS